MSEVQDPVIDELEAEPIQTNSGPIEDFLKAIEDQNFTQAERQFNDIVGDRLQDTLDQAKARIAASIHNQVEDEEPEEDEQEDYDYDDEEDNDVEK